MKRTRADVAKMILKGVAVGGMLVAVIALPGLASVLTLFQDKDKRRNEKIFQSLRNLERKKFVRILHKDGKEYVEITELGKQKLYEMEYENLSIVRPKKWDGLWRVVAFDIPEKRVKARRELSYKLRDMGFLRLQDSMFVSPFDCKKEVDYVKEFLYVRQFVQFFLVKEIDNQSDLLSRFGLST